jgi:hypothetical protein
VSGARAVIVVASLAFAARCSQSVPVTIQARTSTPDGRAFATRLSLHRAVKEPAPFVRLCGHGLAEVPECPDQQAGQTAQFTRVLRFGQRVVPAACVDQRQAVGGAMMESRMRVGDRPVLAHLPILRLLLLEPLTQRAGLVIGRRRLIERAIAVQRLAKMADPLRMQAQQ